MRILIELARRGAFFLLDALKGAQVREALDLLEKCDESDFDAAFVQNYQSEQIQKIMTHAKGTTSFYAALSAEKLEDFPVIDKGIIKSRQEDFLSSAYADAKLFYMSTSGSTGTPFVVCQDSRKKKQVNAECIYYSRKLGYDVGKNLTYLRSVVRQVRKSRLKQFLQNQPLICCNDLTKEGIEQIFDEIRSFGKEKKTLLAYASTLDAIARYCRENGRQGAEGTFVSGVISGSEMLSDQTREEIQQLFSCRCVSRYSNEENGVLGQDELSNNNFLINEASYYIEILKLDEDVAAEPGEVGRIVVTDLYNRAMPMIRYDTGDLGAWKVMEYNGKQRRAITSFSGRKVDAVYNTTGGLISANAITNLMWTYTELQQFQFLQMGRDTYHVKLNCGEFLREKQLVEELRCILGASAKISLSYVDEIPVLRSGKRKYIVNEYKRDLQ